MRLTQIQARDFLSFADLTLCDLDPKVNVIVGPNGVGKSNLLHAVELVQRVLEWTNASQPGELPREYAGATRAGVDPQRFLVRVGIRLDAEVERAMLVAWLRMALLSTFAQGHQERVEIIDAHLMTAVEDASVEILCTGSVVVAFESLPAQRFFVGYEFEIAGETCCYVIRSTRHQGGIVRGSLDQGVPPREEGSRQRDLLLLDKVIANAGDSDWHPDFNPERLLPAVGEFVDLGVQSIYNWEHSETARDFIRMFGPSTENRIYMLDLVLTRVLSAMSFVHDGRGAARHGYRTDELTMRAAPGIAEDVPLELFGLKVGDSTDRARFKRIQDLFTGLTGVGFDLHMQPVTLPTTNNSHGEAGFAIDVEIEDGSVVTPLLFSGAGRWEALVLCTAVTGKGTVTILDEPALNLHPTLQSRVLDVIREGAAQTVLITHSPFLVPAKGPEEIEAIVRLTRADGASRIHRVRFDGGEDGIKPPSSARLRQMLRSSDVRSLLFAHAVLLVEGDTDAGALEIWLPQVAAACDAPSPLDLNLVILPADGDSSFQRYIGYLRMFGVPWTVLSDGKALLPGDEKALFRQLPDVVTGEAPDAAAGFEMWRDFWADNGVFTLCATPGEEIEGVLSRSDPSAWREACKRHGRSKARVGSAFAEAAAPPDHLGSIYIQILEHLSLSR